MCSRVFCLVGLPTRSQSILEKSPSRLLVGLPTGRESFRIMGELGDYVCLLSGWWYNRNPNGNVRQ